MSVTEAATRVPSMPPLGTLPRVHPPTVQPQDPRSPAPAMPEARQADPAWWRDNGQMGEADTKEDVRRRGPAAAEDAGKDSAFSFADLIDVINPLQHIPLVSTLYRELTGDAISPAARVAGGALYGGPVGLIAALANDVVRAETGNDIGGHVVATLRDPSGPASPDPGEALAMIEPEAAAEPAAAQKPANDNPVPVRPTEPATPRSTADTLASARSLRADPPFAPGGPAIQTVSKSALDRFIRSQGGNIETAAPSAAPTAASAAPSAAPAASATASVGTPRPIVPPAQMGASVNGATVNGATVQDWMTRALDKYDRLKRDDQQPG